MTVDLNENPDEVKMSEEDLRILYHKFVEMAERCDTLDKMEKFCLSFLKKHGTKETKDRLATDVNSKAKDNWLTELLKHELMNVKLNEEKSRYEQAVKNYSVKDVTDMSDLYSKNASIKDPSRYMTMNDQFPHDYSRDMYGRDSFRDEAVLGEWKLDTNATTRVRVRESYYDVMITDHSVSIPEGQQITSAITRDLATAIGKSILETAAAEITTHKSPMDYATVVNAKVRYLKKG